MKFIYRTEPNKRTIDHARGNQEHPALAVLEETSIGNLEYSKTFIQAVEDDNKQRIEECLDRLIADDGLKYPETIQGQDIDTFLDESGEIPVKPVFLGESTEDHAHHHLTLATTEYSLEELKMQLIELFNLITKKVKALVCKYRTISEEDFEEVLKRHEDYIYLLESAECIDDEIIRFVELHFPGFFKTEKFPCWSLRDAILCTREKQEKIKALQGTHGKSVQITLTENGINTRNKPVTSADVPAIEEEPETKVA